MNGQGASARYVQNLKQTPLPGRYNCHATIQAVSIVVDVIKSRHSIRIENTSEYAMLQVVFQRDWQ